MSVVVKRVAPQYGNGLVRLSRVPAIGEHVRLRQQDAPLAVVAVVHLPVASDGDDVAALVHLDRLP